MKRHIGLYLMIAALPYSCTDKVQFVDLVLSKKLSQTVVVADGKSATELELVLNRKADTDLSAVELELSKGTFESTGNDTYTFKPSRTKDGEIKAKANIISPLTPGKVLLYITVQGFKDSLEFEATRSISNSIDLQASSFSVQANFGNEIEITGTLRNLSGDKVSLGMEVVIKEFLENGSQFSGFRRKESLKSDKNSAVSIIYTPGNIEPNQTITLKAFVLSEDLDTTAINDELSIFVVEKE